MLKSFDLTEEHIALLRRAYVGWQYCETGAPEIDPKRPYGNSDVAGDVIEIVKHGKTLNRGKEYGEEEEEKALALHRETETALQIILSTGKFEAGTYAQEGFGEKWHLVTNE